MATRRARSTSPAAAKVWADAARAEALSNEVLARAARGEYLLIGPSARTWRRDPATGDPVAPASDAEHLAVRDLLGRETLGSTEPMWVSTADGATDVHSIVTVTPDEAPFEDELAADACSRAHHAVTAATSSSAASPDGDGADRPEVTCWHGPPVTAADDGPAAGVWC